MLRALRKYKSWIIGIGGSILMVLFLLPSTATQMAPNMLAESIGTIDGTKVTVADLRAAQDQHDAVGAIMPEVLMFLGFGGDQDRSSTAERWLLMAYEARKAGLVGHDRDGESFIADAAEYGADMRQAMMRQRMIQTGNVDPAQVLAEYQGRAAAWVRSTGDPTKLNEAMAVARGMIRLTEAAGTRTLISTRELTAAGHRLLDTATFGAVVIPAGSITADIPEPTAERIADHFEKYKNVDSRSDPAGIGYLQPDAVDLEYLKVDRNAISAALTLDAVEVNKYFRQHADRFPGDFAANRTQVENAYRNERLTQIMDQAEKVIRQQVFRSVQTLPLQGLYRTLPEDWDAKKPQLNALAELLDAELKKTVPGPSSYVSVVNDSQWRSLETLNFIGGIGSSSMSFGERGNASFAQYAMTVRELAGDTITGVQRGMIHGPLTDFGGSHYFIRINKVRKQGPPESMDEFKAAVIADIRTLDAMDKLKADAEVFRSRAAADGLQKLGEAYSVPAQWGYEATREAIRRVGGAPADPSMNQPELRDALVSAAEMMDPRVDPTTIDADQRTVAVAIPSARGLIVAQVTRWRPMTVETFRGNLPRIEAIARRDAGQSMVDLFGVTRMAARHNFKPKVAAKASPEAETTDEPKPQETKPAG
jgi:hypothetical protein